MNRSPFAVALAAGALLIPVTSAGAAPDTRAAKTCGEVNAGNGGQARSIAATGGTTCRTARRVARRATGKRFTALGFECRPTRVPGEFNKLYGCAKPGTRKGIGFFYKGPGR